MSDFNKNNKVGMKVISNQTWNNLFDTLDNVKVGDDTFQNQFSPGQGIQLNTDTFFNQHIAEIETDYTTAVIGKSRTEEFYPYVDTLGMLSFYEDIYLVKNGASWAVDDADKFSEGKTVVFLEENTKTPVKPTDPLDGAIVGYSWLLSASVTDMDWDGSFLYVRLQWSPADVFDTDPQSSIYTDTYDKDDPQSWGPTFVSSTSLTTLEEIINNNLSSYSSTAPLVSITLDYDSDLENFGINIPVARYDWNLEQTELERCVQLPIYIPGGSGSSVTPDSQGIPHPFKSRIKPDYPTTVEVGFLRPDWKDNITIENPHTDNDDVIAFGAIEEIELDTVSPFKNYYVYYDIYYDTTANDWTADLEKTETWPPTQDTAGTDATMTGNIIRQIGYAEYDTSNDTYIWYQHMFEDPLETPLQPRGEFEAWYVNDGKVRIESGTVESFNDSGTVIGTTVATDFDLSTNTDIWVQIISTQSSGDPSVAITGTLQSGTYPGLYKKISEATHQFNYHIGSIASYEYIPKHLGRLHIDNTLLMPDVNASYTSAIDSPRMMEFHDNQVTLVGDSLNDKLVDAKFLEVQVRGGGVQHLVEGTQVLFYGLTETGTYDPATVTGVDGVAYGSGSMTVSVESRDYEWDRGLVQQFETVSPTLDIAFEAGANMRIDYGLNTATFVSKGGVTQDLIPDSFDVSGVNGSIEGSGSITITAKSIDNEIDDGHVQTLDVANSTLTAQIAAGTGCSIAYAAGVATINVEAASDYVDTKNSIEWDAGALQLVGDSLAPGNDYFYGTNNTGVKGFNALTEITVVTDVALSATGVLTKTTKTVFVWDPSSATGPTSAGSLTTTTCP